MFYKLPAAKVSFVKVQLFGKSFFKHLQKLKLQISSNTQQNLNLKVKSVSLIFVSLMGFPHYQFHRKIQSRIVASVILT